MITEANCVSAIQATKTIRLQRDRGMYKFVFIIYYIVPSVVRK